MDLSWRITNAWWNAVMARMEMRIPILVWPVPVFVPLVMDQRTLIVLLALWIASLLMLNRPVLMLALPASSCRLCWVITAARTVMRLAWSAVVLSVRTVLRATARSCWRMVSVSKLAATAPTPLMECACLVMIRAPLARVLLWLSA